MSLESEMAHANWFKKIDWSLIAESENPDNAEIIEQISQKISHVFKWNYFIDRQREKKSKIFKLVAITIFEICAAFGISKEDISRLEFYKGKGFGIKNLGNSTIIRIDQDTISAIIRTIDKPHEKKILGKEICELFDGLTHELYHYRQKLFRPNFNKQTIIANMGTKEEYYNDPGEKAARMIIVKYLKAKVEQLQQKDRSELTSWEIAIIDNAGLLLSYILSKGIKYLFIGKGKDYEERLTISAQKLKQSQLNRNN